MIKMKSPKIDKQTHRSPLECVRSRCLSCAGNAAEVAACTSTKCELYHLRFGRNPFDRRVPTNGLGMLPHDRIFRDTQRKSRHSSRSAHNSTWQQIAKKLGAKSPELAGPTVLQSIAAHCKRCMGDDRQAVADCGAAFCGVHSMRLGKNPAHRRVFTPAQVENRLGRLGLSAEKSKRNDT